MSFPQALIVASVSGTATSAPELQAEFATCMVDTRWLSLGVKAQSYWGQNGSIVISSCRESEFS
jgi:hypothetical protein